MPCREGLCRDQLTRPGLSARADDRILKVSRTIADLEGFPKKSAQPTRAEAVGYPSLDSYLLDVIGFVVIVDVAGEIEYLLGRVRQRRAQNAASHTRD